ncbi:hypothetical protein EYM_03445 [Ignicoccus islandicus DSM 13165]|uniref:Uncharacterized protein n=1 Tax=Ignicoccus islandicus DSM 13165 TaxID=940295 RepID=A0A0U3DY43_9CREN|nr:hypothetical protein [Ignicoccus islandicus]ALU12410.1 hypothetical protein EYM_03445 [Ignicoccus islandicus DSM 13165]
MLLIISIGLRAQPLPYLNIEMVHIDHLRYLQKSNVTLNVCNVSPILLQGTSLEITSSDSIILGAREQSLGALQRSECKRVNFEIVPLNDTANVLVVVYTMVPSKGGFSQLVGKYLITLPVKLNDISVRTTKLLDRLVIRIFNNSTFETPFLLLKLQPSIGKCLSSKVIKIGTINPNGFKDVYITVDRMENCLVNVSILDRRGKLFYKDIIDLDFEYVKPSLKFIPSTIFLCPNLVPLSNVTITLDSTNSIIEPSLVKLEELRKCRTIQYLLMDPKPPITITVKVKSNNTLAITGTYNIENIDLNLEVNRTSVFSGVRNTIEVALHSPYNLKNVYVEIIPSVGVVDPNVVYVDTNKTYTITWLVPAILPNKDLEMKFKLLNREIVKRFAVHSIDYEFGITYLPGHLTEGSFNNLKMCIRNYNKVRLRDVKITVDSAYFTKKFYLSEINANSQNCIDISNVPVPWDVKEYRMRVNINSREPQVNKTIAISIPVVQNLNIPLVNVSSSQYLLEPGTQTVYINISNIGLGSLYDAVLKVNGKNVIFPRVEVPLGVIKPLSGKNVKLVLNVPPTASTVDVNIELSYCKGDLGIPCSKEIIKRNLEFQVKTYQGPYIVALYQPQKTISNILQKVSFKLCNEGDLEAKEIRIEFKSPSNDVELVNNTIIVIPELKPKKCTHLDVSFIAFNVQKETFIDIPYRIEYLDKWLSKFTKNGILRVIVTPQKVAKISLTPFSNVLIEGDKRILRVSIVNIGSKEASNVRLYPFSNDIIIIPQNVSLERILPGQRVVITFTYSIPYGTPTGNNNLGFLVKYFNGNEEVSETYNFPVKVIRGPHIKIGEIQQYPDKVFVGSVCSLTLTISNDGDFNANNVIVKIKTSNGLKVIGSSSINLGTLQPSSTVPISYVLKVPEVASPGTYPVEIEVEYYFNGVRYTDRKTTSLIVLPSTPALEKVSWLGKALRSAYFLYLMALVIVLGVIIAKLIKKRVKR